MSFWQQLTYYLSLITFLGITVACCVIIGYFLGVYFDKLMSTNMVFTIVGVLLGAISGLYMMYRVAIRVVDRQK